MCCFPRGFTSFSYYFIVLAPHPRVIITVLDEFKRVYEVAKAHRGAINKDLETWIPGQGCSKRHQISKLNALSSPKQNAAFRHTSFLHYPSSTEPRQIG